MIPEPDLARLQSWVDERNLALPDHVRDQLRYELDTTDRAATIVECRPYFQPEVSTEWTRLPVAKFRYWSGRRCWSLYWSDSNTRWHTYELVDQTPHIDELIAEVEEDPTAIFWG
jgi:hypothetical protein